MKNTKASRAPAGLPFIPGGPIDWAAWAAEAAQPRGNKGRKRSPEIRAKLSAAQKKRFAEKREQLAKALAAQRAFEAANPKPAIYDPLMSVATTDKVLGNMEPGEWYATPDMAKVSGAKYQACKAFAVTWWRKGILVRRQNPDWKPPERVGAPQEPKWLYGLSQVGEQRHKLAAALL